MVLVSEQAGPNHKACRITGCMLYMFIYVSVSNGWYNDSERHAGSQAVPQGNVEGLGWFSHGSAGPAADKHGHVYEINIYYN